MLDKIKDSLSEFTQYYTDEQLSTLIQIADEDFKLYGLKNISNNLFKFTLSYVKIHIYKLFTNFSDFGNQSVVASDH